MFWTIILAIAAIVCGIGWLKCNIGLHAVLLYLLGKEYTPPTDDEMKACVEVVIKRMLGMKP